MKFNFKKIMSIVASTVMLSSTIALAAAASYPAPFVNGGNADVAIVYGSNAGVTDLVAVSDIQTQLATTLAQQTTASSSTGASATGGDNVNLASSSQNLFYGSAINSAKSTLTNTDMPNVLADGTVTDNSGTSYTYTQSVILGNTKVAYGVPTGAVNIDPIMYLNVGNDPTSPAYTYKLNFNKAINVSSPNVVGNTITILGTPYTIGANSVVTGLPSDVVYLYGSGNQINLNEGSSQTVTVNGQQYTIQITGITQTGSNNQVYLSVNGGSTQTINQGSASNLGGLQIYAKTVFYSGKTGSTNYATLSIGSNILQLTNGQQVAVGTDAIALQGTKVGITGSSAGLSALNVSIAMPNGTLTYIGTGQKLTDPVFGGLALQYADTNPSLNASSNDDIIVDTDNSRNVRVSYNSPLSGQASAFSFLHDQRSDTSTGTPLLTFADTGNYSIIQTEGAGVGYEQYTTINSGDYGRIVRVTSLPTGTLQSSSTIQVQDAISGQNLLGDSGLTVGISGNATSTIDGQTYYFHVNNGTALTGTGASSVNITWGNGAGYGNTGNTLAIDPRIKLENGEWIALLKPVTVNNGTAISLPGLDSVSDYESGLTVTAPNVTGTDTVGLAFGNVNYTFSVTAGTPTTLTLDGVNVKGTVVSFNSTTGGAVLVQEEKKTTESGNSNYGDAVVIGTGTEGTGNQVDVRQPYITGNSSGYQSWNSNSNVLSSLDRYGTEVTFDSSNNNVANVLYPVQQTLSDVLVTADSAVVTSGSSGGNGLKALGSVIVSDSEVSSVSTDNLIVVGGGCVNSVAASLLGSSTPLCGSDWQAASGSGSGSFLIKTFASPYSASAVATLVAGYDAPDTTNAAKALMTQSIDTSVGKAYTGTVANSVTLQTAASSASDMNTTNSSN